MKSAEEVKEHMEREKERGRRPHRIPMEAAEKLRAQEVQATGKTQLGQEAVDIARMEELKRAG